jgi:hypothetical protein
MTALYVRGPAPVARARLWSAAAIVATALISSGPVPAGEPIAVNLDQARILKLPDRAATVVIGNPLIADVAMQPGGIAVVTGKGYGSTNFVVMDRAGAILAEKSLEVRGPSDRIVVVYRGAERETYSCTPECARRMTLGDRPEYFDKTLAQITNRNSQATAAGSLAAGH